MIKRPLLLILALYTIANFFMLLNNGVFWDDWCIYNMDFKGIEEIYLGVGLKFMVPITWYLQHLTSTPALLYHFITFGIELLEIILFYKLLENLITNSYKVFWLTAFFALIPYNDVKITMISMPYTIGLFLFILGSYLFSLFIKQPTILFRTLSLLVYFCAFAFLNSTLVLMLGFVLFMAFYVDYQNSASWQFKHVKKNILSWLDFIALPFIFWIFRLSFLMPANIYVKDHYNEISIKNLLIIPKGIYSTIQKSILGLGFETFNSIYLSIFIFTLFAVLTIVLIYILKPISAKDRNIGSLKMWFIIGFYFFVLGTFAYLAVNKIPSFSNHDSRHQILLRLSVPLMLIACLEIFKNDRTQKNIGCIILSLFVVTTVSQNLDYLSSWLKMSSLEKHFSVSNDIRNNKGIIVFDNAKNLNETTEDYHFYCYNGILKKVFDDESHFMISPVHLNGLKKIYDLKDLTQLVNYNMHNYKGSWNLNNYILIENNYEVPANHFQIISLVLKSYFSKAEFDRKINDYVNVRFFPMNKPQYQQPGL